MPEGERGIVAAREEAARRRATIRIQTLLSSDVVGPAGPARDGGVAGRPGSLASFRAGVRPLLARAGGRELRATERGLLAGFDSPEDAVRTALGLVHAARAAGLHVRVGVHADAGRSGAGRAVAAAAGVAERIMACARPGEVLVSAEARDLLAGSGLVLTERAGGPGGGAGSGRVFAVEPGSAVADMAGPETAPARPAASPAPAVPRQPSVPARSGATPGESFGELLRRLRVGASLTQEALAERCRISPAAVAAIEQGRRRTPRLSTVRLIAEALGLSGAELEAFATAADRGAGSGREPAGGRPADPPAVRTPAAVGTPPAAVRGLRPARTSFIGRERELATVLEALAANQVVTLVGPGGVGKTRLAARVAQEVSARYALGAVFVDLVSVREGFLTQAVAALLGVTEQPGLSLDAALQDYLGRWSSLLVFDNCEHVLEAAAVFVEKLLANCPEVSVLATSRERLAIPGERTVTVPPLSLAAAPSPGDAGSEAEALFVERATANDLDPAVAREVAAEVCSRLDGMPLAIELAAARSASLGAEGLLAGLDDRLRLLAGHRGVHERHRSLRAVLDWGYELLDADERAMFRRVGAFSGAFDLRAAAAVWPGRSSGEAADLLGRLSSKSLLGQRHAAGGSRWHLLGTIQAYARERLADSGELDQVLEAHLRWAAAVADDLERRVVAGEGWSEAFDAVAGDLRAAAARAAGADREVSHRLARALGRLAYARGFLVEAGQHFRSAAALAGDAVAAAGDLWAAADVALVYGQGDAAFDLLLASAERARAGGDPAAGAAALGYAVTVADRFVGQFTAEVPTGRLLDLLEEAARNQPPDDHLSAAHLAAARAWTGHPEKSVPDPELAVGALAAARRTCDLVLVSGALDAVVAGLDAGGHLREAHQVNKERAGVLQRLPRHDPRAGTEIVDGFHMIMGIAVAAGDLPDALASARLAQDDALAAGVPHVAASKPVLPLVLQGRFREARDYAARMWASWEKAGRPPARWMGPALYAMVLADGLCADGAGGPDWLARVGDVTGPGGPAAANNLAEAAAFADGRVALHEGRLDAALAAVAAVPYREQPWYETPRWSSLRAYAWAVAAEVAVVAGLDDAAECLAAAAPAARENYWAAACLDRAAGRLHGDRAALERSVAGWERIDAVFERASTLVLLPDRADEGLAELRSLGCRPPVAWTVPATG